MVAGQKFMINLMSMKSIGNSSNLKEIEEMVEKIYLK